MAAVFPYANSQRPQTESHVSANPFASEPEIYGENIFTFDEKSNILLVAENLTSEAKHLIHILQTTQPWNIREQFQIELRKIDNLDEKCSTYSMSLRINSVLWFKHHELNNGEKENLEQLYQIGSSYVDKVKGETEHYPKVENENDIQRIPMNNSVLNSWCKMDRQEIKCPKQNDFRQPCQFNHYNWCPDENYGLTGECDTTIVTTKHNRKHIHFSEIDMHKKPAYYQCRFQSTSLNRQKLLCRFQVDPNFWIYSNKVAKPSNHPYFIVAARPNAIPVITLNPVKHCLNEQYVQTSDAWQAVLQTLIYMKNKLELDELPVNRIYINFGKWMQQKADDPMYRNCHAHINIVLSRETIDKIDQSYKSNDKSINVKKWFPSLVGSILPLKSHRLHDSLELLKYMTDHMTPVLFKQNQELKRTISILKDEVEKVEQEIERLRRLMLSQTQDGEETDDTLCGVCTSDCGMGINNKVYVEELTPTDDE